MGANLKGKLLIMDETVTYIFKQDASKLEDTMSKGYDRRTTDKGNVYFSNQTEKKTPDVDKSNTPMCKPTQYEVMKLTNQ